MTTRLYFDDAATARYMQRAGIDSAPSECGRYYVCQDGVDLLESLEPRKKQIFKATGLWPKEEIEHERTSNAA